MKKILTCFFIIICSFFLISNFYQSKTSKTNIFDEPCAFCNLTILDHQKFYEDDLVMALYTHKPVFAGHCLIIPKRHVERLEMLTENEFTQINQVIKKVHQAASKVFHTSSYLILQKNGREVGQTVPHVHFHYIPRATGDDSTLKFLARMYIANFKQPLSVQDMQTTVLQLKEAMDSLN